MKRTGNCRKSKVFFLVLMGCLLFFAGCKTDDFSRYPSLSIPQYSQEDYDSLLSNHNPEIVYNAVCILGTQAEDIGKTLKNKKADRDAPEFKKALDIYQKIT